MAINQVVEKAITGANQFSERLRVVDAKFSVSIRSSAMSATVTLQRKLPEDDDTAWRDVENFTANAEKIVESVGAWDWRIGCKTGNFTSATGLVAQVVHKQN